MEAELSSLIFERDLYELLVYDILVDPFAGVPESFWEPVEVSFDNVKELQDIIGEDECYICSENHLNFKSLSCCNQKMCNGCSYSWFKKSVNCPYCYQDIREFHLKKSDLKEQKDVRTQ